MDASASKSRLHDLAPGIVAAISFSLADVLGKVVLVNGADVLTLSTFRGLVTVAFMVVWLSVDKPPVAHTPRQRLIALALGVLFSGIVFGLYKAMQFMPVPLTILSYFVYPLLTGLIGAWFGIDTV